MAFDLKKLVREDGLKPEYVCTKYMMNVNEAGIKKLDAAQQFALGQIDYQQTAVSTSEEQYVYYVPGEGPVLGTQTVTTTTVMTEETETVTGY